MPAISGPKRPQDYVALTDAQSAFRNEMEQTFKRPMGKKSRCCRRKLYDGVREGCDRLDHNLYQHFKPLRYDQCGTGGTQSCDVDLDKIGFNLVGYGCTTCIGNSEPLQTELTAAIAEGDLVATAVLLGNRNFERRISPDVCANYLASPPLVVAYVLAGTMDIDLSNDPLGQDKDGYDVCLKGIWPTSQDVAELVERTVTRQAFLSKYADVFKGDDKWQGVETTDHRPMTGHQHPPMCRTHPIFRI